MNLNDRLYFKLFIMRYLDCFRGKNSLNLFRLLACL